MLQYNEIREKKVIIYNKEPYEVVYSHVARTQQRKPQNQVKLKSLVSGKTVSATFHVSDKAQEADIEKREVKFLYHNREEYWFCSKDDPSERFKLEEGVVAAAGKFMKENEKVEVLVWSDGEEEKIINVSLPVKMEFKVKSAPPSLKGNTAQGGNKIVTLENGTDITTPMFIESGDTVRVNTETGEYVERV